MYKVTSYYPRKKAEEFYLETLFKITPYFPRKEIEEFYKEVIRYIDAPSYLSNTCILSFYMPEIVLDATENSLPRHIQFEILGNLANYMPEIISDIVESISDENVIAKILCNLSPYLPELVLNLAETMLTRAFRVDVLRSLLPYISLAKRDYICKEILRIGKDHRDDIAYANIIIDINPYISKSVQQDVYEEILRIARKTTVQDNFFRIINILNPYLSDKQRKEVYQDGFVLAIASKDASSKCVMISYVIGNLMPVQYEIAREQLFQHIKEILDEKSLITIILNIALYAPELIQELIGTKLIEERHVGILVKVITLFQGHLPKMLYKEGIELSKRINDNTKRLKLLGVLSKEFEDEDISNAIVQCQQILSKISFNPRFIFLEGLYELIIFMFTLVRKEDNNTFQKIPQLTLQVGQCIELGILIGQYIASYDLMARLAFLERTGLLLFESRLPLTKESTIFGVALVRETYTEGISEDGIPYFVNLLTYLHDVEWVGHIEHQRYIKELFGKYTVSTKQQELAQGILEAVRAVCTWWP